MIMYVKHTEFERNATHVLNINSRKLSARCRCARSDPILKGTRREKNMDEKRKRRGKKMLVCTKN